MSTDITLTESEIALILAHRAHEQKRGIVTAKREQRLETLKALTVGESVTVKASRGAKAHRNGQEGKVVGFGGTSYVLVAFEDGVTDGFSLNAVTPAAPRH